MVCLLNVVARKLKAYLLVHLLCASCVRVWINGSLLMDVRKDWCVLFVSFVCV